MRLSKQNRANADLAERIAQLSEYIIEAASEAEIFEIIGAEFSYAAWAIDGPVLRERYASWRKDLERAVVKPLAGKLEVPLDAEVVPPHFFANRRFRRTPRKGMIEAFYRSMRDGRGRKLQDEEIQAALRLDPRAQGVYGPVLIFGAPWGLLSFRWDDASEEDLDLFTLLAAQVGAALHVVGTRESLLRADHELKAIHTLARSKESRRHPSSYLPILESAAAVTESDTSVLFLFDEPSEVVRLAGHWGAPCEWTKGNVRQRDQFFARAIESRQPLEVERTHAEQPWIALLPLMAEERTLGILLISRRPTSRPYGFQELARAGLLASQLAVQLENWALLEETRRQNEVLRGLYRLSRLLSQSAERDLSLKGALDLLVDGLGFAGAWVFALEGETLHCRADAGSIRLPFPAPQPVDSDHPIARTFRKGEPYVGPGCPESEGCTFLVLPLETANDSVGCLVVARDAGSEFERHDWDLIESCGAQIALALGHARLRQVEEARVRQLRFHSEVGQIAMSGRLDRSKLLGDFLQATASTLGFDAAFGFFPDGEGGEEFWIAGEELPQPVKAGMRELATLVNKSLCEVRESQIPRGDETFFLCAMLARSPAGAQAVFALARRSIPIGIQEFETLAAAGSKLGFALEDAARLANAQKSIDEMKLILDVGNAVTSTSEPGELLGTTARAVNRLVGATRTAILLYDEERDELRCAALSSEEGAPLRHGQRFRNAKERLPSEVLAIERAVDAPPDLRKLYEENGVESSLTVRMDILGEPVGCIWIMDETGPREWTPAQVKRVEVIAHQVAIGIANHRLHADLRASNLELARAQEALIEKERLAALGELAAVVAHEVRNPLGVIFNSMSSLERLLRPEGDVKTLLDIVGEEANRLDRIVSDLLDFSRPNPVEPSWTDIGALVSDLAATFPAEPGIELLLEMERDLPRVHVDAQLLRQALINLLQNGMQAMPKGGRLRLSLRGLDRRRKALVAISVSDEGAGIPEELSSKIFEPFFTTKAKGSGLGLALVKRIVEAHRARLHFDSTMGRGSTFTIEIEATEPKDE